MIIEKEFVVAVSRSSIEYASQILLSKRTIRSLLTLCAIGLLVPLKLILGSLSKMLKIRN